jgi:hypothetical protein
MTGQSRVESLVRQELLQPVDARVAEFAEVIANRYGKAARAVLFYGSCLRESQLDGLMLDFYLIVSNYRAAYGRSWLATANRLVPPNVFPVEHDGLMAKYAVLSETDFLRECGLGARSVSVYARFAQPARLVWAADDAASEMAIRAIAKAAPTLLELTRSSMTDDDAADPLEIWRKGFGYTYGAELRAERNSRPGSIVDVDPDRYRRFAEAVGFPAQRGYTAAQRRSSEQAWRQAQRRGKRITALRLAKASFTFAGGADYLVWKINRHAGTQIELKPWQRRWPLVGSLVLLPRLLRQGAVR